MFIVSTSEKKKVEEKVFFSDDNGRKITLIIGWRDGKVWCDDEPDLSDYDPENGSDMALLAEYSDEEETDGWFFEVEVTAGEVSDEEKSNIEDAWNNSLEDGMKTIGWNWSDRELWFYGELEVEEE
jgi:hypothetical protein